MEAKNDAGNEPEPPVSCQLHTSFPAHSMTQADSVVSLPLAPFGCWWLSAVICVVTLLEEALMLTRRDVKSIKEN